MGDLIRIEFRGKIAEDDLAHSEGVIRLSVSENVCEIIVDHGESRLGPLLAMLSQGGVQIQKVTLGQTDLEDVFIEFAKEDRDKDLSKL